MFKEIKLTQEENVKRIKNILNIEFNIDGNKYDRLYCDIVKKKIYDNLELYSSENLKRVMSETLSEREMYIIEKRYGLSLDSLPKTQKDIGLEIGVSQQRVGAIEQEALRKLRHPSKRVEYSYEINQTDDKELLTVNEINIIKSFENDLYEKGILLDSNMEQEKINDIIGNKDNKKAIEIIKNINQIREERKKEIEEIRLKNRSLDNIGIEEMEISLRAYSALIRAGKKTLSDLKEMRIQDFMNMKNLSERSCNEVINELKKYGIMVKDNCEKSELTAMKEKKKFLQEKEKRLQKEVKNAGILVNIDKHNGYYDKIK